MLKFEVKLNRSFGESDNRYLRHGVPHRIDGPSILFSFARIEYYQYGVRHRWDGPSFVHRSQRHFYVRGKPYTKWDFTQHPVVIELNVKKCIESNAWLPMDTAPRTGEIVLVGNHLHKCISTMRYTEGWGSMHSGGVEVEPTLWYPITPLPDSITQRRY